MEDLLAAVDVLACEGLAAEVQRYAAGPLAPSLDLHLHRLDGLLKGAVDRLIEELFRKPPDYQKELFALHMWNTSAHDELDAASKVCPSTLGCAMLRGMASCTRHPVCTARRLLRQGCTFQGHPSSACCLASPTHSPDKPAVVGANVLPGVPGRQLLQMQCSLRRGACMHVRS